MVGFMKTPAVFEPKVVMVCQLLRDGFPLDPFLFLRMSRATDLNIDHVAKLARIELSAEEKTRYARQLGDVLQHIEQLAKVDVAGIEPSSHAFALANVWGEDVARPGLATKDVLRNAPAHSENRVAVPKIVD